MNARSAAHAAAALEADRRRVVADHAARNPGEIPFDATPAPVKRVVMATRLTHPPVVDSEWLEMQPCESEADYIARIWPDIAPEAY